MKYFLNFIEEIVFDPKYSGYIGGRVEVFGQEDKYARMELRFFTDDLLGFYKFRDEYDFKDVNIRLYRKFRRELKEFQEEIK